MLLHLLAKPIRNVQLWRHLGRLLKLSHFDCHMLFLFGHFMQNALVFWELIIANLFGTEYVFNVKSIGLTAKHLVFSIPVLYKNFYALVQCMRFQNRIRDERGKRWEKDVKFWSIFRWGIISKKLVQMWYI